MEIIYSSHFQRSASKLTVALRTEAEKRELFFRKNPFDSKLKTHKLKGKNRDIWSFSISYKHRVLFRFVSVSAVEFIDVGDHSIYQ